MKRSRFALVLGLIAVSLLWVRVSHRVIHAPELIRGRSASVQLGAYRVAVIDGGNWQALLVGRRYGQVEVGNIYRVAGEHIDNNDMPVPYYIEWKKGRFDGIILFRPSITSENGNRRGRKICGAVKAENLPCK